MPMNKKSLSPIGHEPTQKKSWGKKILIVFFIFLLIIGGLYAYVTLVFLPKNLKNIIASKAEEFLHRKVTIGSIEATILHGITIKDLTIQEPDSNPAAFIHIHEINCQILLAPIFKSGFIIIPSLKIVQPEIHVARKTENTFNFSDLLSPASPSSSAAPTSPSSSPAYKLAIHKLLIENGTISFTDQSKPALFSETLDHVNLNASLSLSQKLQFDLNVTLSSSHSPIQLKGDYELSSKKAHIDVSTQNIDLAFYAAQFLDEKMNVLRKGTLREGTFKINYAENNIEASGKVDLAQADIRLSETQHFSGDITLSHFSGTYKNGDIEGTVDLDANVHTLEFTPLRLAQTNFSAQLSSFSFSKDTLSAAGNITSSHVDLKIDPSIEYKGILKLTEINLVKNGDDINFSGNITSEETDLTLSPTQHLKGNLSLTKIQASLKGGSLQYSGDIELDNADGAMAINEKQTVQFTGKCTALKTELSKNNNIIKAQSSLTLSGANVDLGNGMTFKDSSHMQFSIEGDLSTPPQFITKGLINFEDASLTGLPTVKTVDHLKGSIAFETNTMNLDQISLETLGTLLKIKGIIHDFTQPQADLEIEASQINLENLTPLITEYIKGIKLDLSGQAQVKAKFKGAIAKPLEADVTIHSTFSDVTVISDKLPDQLTQLSGTASYSKDEIQFHEVTGNFLKNNFALNGKVSHFKSPTADISLIAQDFNADIQVESEGQHVQISKLNGQYFKSSFDIKGSAELRENSEPELNLNGKFNLDLSDLKNFPPLADPLKTVNPVGNVTAEGTFKGRLKDLHSWASEINLSSPRITLAGHPVENMIAKYKQEANTGKGSFILGSSIYGGKLSADATIGIEDPQFPIQLQTKLEKLDLSQLRQMKELQGTDISGFVSLNAQIEGPAKDVNQCTGEGSLVVVEGYLGRLKFMDGILGALLIVPQFQNIFITDASVNFIIRDGRISSDDILLASSAVQLTGRGWVDFKSNMNVEISPNLSQIALAQSDSAKKFPTELLSNAISVKCEGTLNQPKCGLSNTPGKILQETTDILKDGIKSVGDILEGLF